MLNPHLCPCLFQVHHPAGSQIGGRGSQTAGHRHQRRVLEVGGHQVQEERSLHGRHRVRESTGEDHAEQKKYIYIGRKLKVVNKFLLVLV